MEKFILYVVGYACVVPMSKILIETVGFWPAVGWMTLAAVGDGIVALARRM